MPTVSLYKKVYSVDILERAWHSVRDNGRKSQSAETQAEIEAFSGSAGFKLRSLQHRLSRRQYRFPPAKGIAVPRPGKTPRPLVIASVESRIVQRAILEVLTDVKALEPFFRNPHSFGGIRKAASNRHAGVPAAIDAVRRAIVSGSSYAIYADIEGFFTKIPSQVALRKVVEATPDEHEFHSLLFSAVEVILANADDLRVRELIEIFPAAEIGVAQGSPLSPLLGNILLSDFDSEMNDSESVCIRYIDDFIILAPNPRAASLRLKRAKRILGGLGLRLSNDKSQAMPAAVEEGIEFLGISIHNGLIRPTRKAQARVTESIRREIVHSLQSVRRLATDSTHPGRYALAPTLKRLCGMYEGWGKHYDFCNDIRIFHNLDGQVYELITKYVFSMLRNIEDSDYRINMSLLGLSELASMPDKRRLKWLTGFQEDRLAPLTHPSATRTRSSRTAPRPARSLARPRGAGG